MYNVKNETFIQISNSVYSNVFERTEFDMRMDMLYGIDYQVSRNIDLVYLPIERYTKEYNA